MNPWTYNNSPVEEIPEGCIGFVYKLTNTTNGKFYIGKKNFWSSQTKQKTVILKTTGEKKKKKIRSKKESDWQTYHGSSEDVQKDVELLGAETFTREILRMCTTKGELSYYEAKYQFEEDVLLKPNQYYNGWISCKIHRAHLKHLLDK